MENWHLKTSICMEMTISSSGANSILNGLNERQHDIEEEMRTSFKMSCIRKVKGIAQMT